MHNTTMKQIFFAVSLTIAICQFVRGQDDGYDGSNLYSRRYENLNIDTILASPRLVTNYVECLLNKKPCPPEGKALKRILPEALRTKCSKCWPSQKEGALKVITSLYFNYPQYYKALREKWDPTGEYNRRFEEYLRDQKFNSIGSNGSDLDAGEQPQGSSVSLSAVTQRPTREGSNQRKTPPTPPPGVAQDEYPVIANRFGADEDEGGYQYESPGVTARPQTTMKPRVNSTTSQSIPQRPAARPMNPVPKPSSTHSGGHAKPSASGSSSGSSQSSGSINPSSSHNRPQSVPSQSGGSQSHNWNSNGQNSGTVTTTYYIKTQNPVLNIINRITMKFANTAEFLAGMLRGVSPQSQPMQRY